MSSALEAFKLSRSAFPLPAFMSLYLSANRECYIEYMQGAKCLANYLAPLAIPLSTTTVPDMLRTYELAYLAKALAPYTSIPLTIPQIEAAIYDYFILR
jgi:hypothetical protein